MHFENFVQQFQFDASPQFRSLSTKAYFSNFIIYERKTAKAFLQVLHVLTAREMSVKAKGLFLFELSLETLLKVCSLFTLSFPWKSPTRIHFIFLPATDFEDDVFDSNALQFYVNRLC